MKTTIDTAGRIVVPKAIRDRLHLSGGVEIEIEEHDGVIEITPAALEIEIIDTPHGKVAHAQGAVSPLTPEMVRQTIEHVREERMSRWIG